MKYGFMRLYSVLIHTTCLELGLKDNDMLKNAQNKISNKGISNHTFNTAVTAQQRSAKFLFPVSMTHHPPPKLVLSSTVAPVEDFFFFFKEVLLLPPQKAHQKVYVTGDDEEGNLFNHQSFLFIFLLKLIFTKNKCCLHIHLWMC